jgi:hypothetical protein
VAVVPFKDAEVLPDGRVLKIAFSSAEDLAAFTWPDYRLAVLAGVSPVLSNGFALTPMGDHYDQCTDFMVEYEILAETGLTIPSTRFAFKFAIFDALGGCVAISANTAKLGANAGTRFDSIGPNQKIRITWGDMPIPEGHTGRIYMTTQDADTVNSDIMGLLRTDIPAGQANIDITDWTFVDSNLRPPRGVRYVGYYLTNYNEAIAYDDVVTLSASEGLVRDSAGNVSAAIVNVPVTNNSMVTSTGTYAEFPVGDGGRAVHISQEFGNDLNDGTLALPVRTHARARALLTNGTGSHTLYRRGEEYPDPVNTLGVNTGGANRLRPETWSSYWHDYGGGGTDPGTRPIIRVDRSNMWVTKVTDNLRNVVVHGLHFKSNLNNQDKGKMYGLGGLTDIFISDCLFERSYFDCGSTAKARSRRVTMHRTVVRDSGAMNPQADEFGKSAYPGHRQGIHANKCINLLISQCTLDHNGWLGAAQTGSNIFSHNGYVNYPAQQTLMHSTFSLDPGSATIQIRGGGNMYGCINEGYANSGGTFTRSGTYRHSIFMGRRANGTTSAPLEAGRANGEHDGSHTTIDECVFGHSLIQTGRAIALSSSDTSIATQVKRFAVLRNNLVLSDEIGNFGCISSRAPSVSTIIDRNIFLGQGQPADKTTMSFRATNQSSLEYLNTRRNLYTTPVSNYFQTLLSGVIANHTLVQMQELGQETESSVVVMPTFINEDYGLGDWNAANGGTGTREAAISRLRERGLGEWFAFHDGNECRKAWFTALTPANLVEVPGETEWNYYGPVNYTESTAVLYEIAGPDTATVGDLLNYTITPSEAPDLTLTLEDDGTPTGTFTPNSVAWEDSDATPKAFTYQPLDAGILTIRARQADAVVASKVINVSAPPVTEYRGTFIFTLERVVRA